jgi:hypothetical protein
MVDPCVLIQKFAVRLISGGMIMVLFLLNVSRFIRVGTVKQSGDEAKKLGMKK